MAFLIFQFSLSKKIYIYLNKGVFFIHYLPLNTSARALNKTWTYKIISIPNPKSHRIDKTMSHEKITNDKHL